MSFQHSISCRKETISRVWGNPNTVLLHPAACNLIPFPYHLSALGSVNICQHIYTYAAAIRKNKGFAFFFQPGRGRRSGTAANVAQEGSAPWGASQCLLVGAGGGDDGKGVAGGDWGSHQESPVGLQPHGRVALSSPLRLSAASGPRWPVTVRGALWLTLKGRCAPDSLAPPGP